MLRDRNGTELQIGDCVQHQVISDSGMFRRVTRLPVWPSTTVGMCSMPNNHLRLLVQIHDVEEYAEKMVCTNCLNVFECLSAGVITHATT